MFVFSIKAGKKKWAVAALAVILAAVTVFLAAGKLHASAGTGNEKGYACEASTNDERIAFLAQFGWQVDTEPLEIREVTIPDPFDEVYTNYNALQKQQGFDLEPLAGKVCRQWVYEVTNYPDENPVHANLLTYEDRVVGGDVSSAALDGFMLPFDAQDGTTSEAPASSAAEESTVESAAPVEEAAPSQAEATPSSEIPANAWPTD